MGTTTAVGETHERASFSSWEPRWFFKLKCSWLTHGIRSQARNRVVQRSHTSRNNHHGKSSNHLAPRRPSAVLVTVCLVLCLILLWHLLITGLRPQSTHLFWLVPPTAPSVNHLANFLRSSKQKSPKKPNYQDGSLFFLNVESSASYHSLTIVPHVKFSVSLAREI